MYVIQRMVHPNISLMFSNESQTMSLFSKICDNITQLNELDEFIKWHLEINSQVINEIKLSQKINFSDQFESRIWAEKFLEEYEKKIRHMRNISNLVFTRYQILKNRDFDRIISEYSEFEKQMKDMMEIFLNKNGLLIGKIIFAYREMWFVANRILFPEFKIGSIKEYQKWVENNLPNLILLEKSLEKIHEEILKKKE